MNCESKFTVQAVLKLNKLPAALNNSPSFLGNLMPPFRFQTPFVNSMESGRSREDTSSTMNLTMKKSKRRREVIDLLIGKVDALKSNNIGDDSVLRVKSLNTAAARLRAEKFDTDCTTSEKESSSLGPDSIRGSEIETSDIICRGSTPLSFGTSRKTLPFQDLQSRVKLDDCEEIYVGQVKVTILKESRKCQNS